jgi:very-short-patch-repair endonuclease
VCLEHKLVIELDGGQHIERAGYDTKRSDYLSGRGFSLLRFWNDEILKQTDAVLEAILLNLRTSPLPRRERDRVRGSR